MFIVVLRISVFQSRHYLFDKVRFPKIAVISFQTSPFHFSHDSYAVFRFTQESFKILSVHFFVSRLLQEICSAPVYDPFHIVRSIFFCDIVASKKRTYFFKPRLKPWLRIPRTFFPLFQQIQTAFQVSEQKFNHGGVINIIGIFHLSPLLCKFCISIFQRFKLYQFPGILQSKSCHTCNFCAKPFPTFIFYIITYSFPSVVKRNGFVQVIGIFKQKSRCLRCNTYLVRKTMTVGILFEQNSIRSHKARYATALF